MVADKENFTCAQPWAVAQVKLFIGIRRMCGQCNYSALRTRRTANLISFGLLTLG